MTRLRRSVSLIGAALLGATLSLPVHAQDRNNSGYIDSGDRGIRTPAAVPEHPRMGLEAQNAGRGRASVPSLNEPASVPNARPSQVGERHQRFGVSSAMAASPITPGNVSDSNMSASLYGPTNNGGLAIGATR